MFGTKIDFHVSFIYVAIKKYKHVVIGEIYMDGFLGGDQNVSYFYNKVR